MAIQQENRFHCGCSVQFDGVLLSRSALVQSVVREGTGTFLLTMSEGVGAAEEVHSLQTAENGKTGSLASAERVNDTQYRIFTYDNAQALTDQTWYFVMHRVSNTNGN